MEDATSGSPSPFIIETGRDGYSIGIELNDCFQIGVYLLRVLHSDLCKDIGWDQHMLNRRTTN